MGMIVPPLLLHFQVHISKHEVSAVVYSGSVQHTVSCVPLLLYPGLCLLSPLNTITPPELNKNALPLSEKLAVFESSSSLSYVCFVKPFPVCFSFLAFILNQSQLFGFYVMCQRTTNQNKEDLNQFKRFVHIAGQT